MSSNGIVYERIRDISDPAFSGFCRVYQEAFSGAPYFENFSEELVREVWEAHVPHFAMIARDPDHGVVGLCCHTPTTSEAHPEVTSFLADQELPFDINESVYMAELAVHSAHRCRSIGKQLILQRMNAAKEEGFPWFVMRTAADGSNSARLYERLGAQKASWKQDVREEGIETSSSHRIYLFGSNTEGLKAGGWSAGASEEAA